MYPTCTRLSSKCLVPNTFAHSLRPISLLAPLQLSKWKTNNVETFDGMFQGATNFNANVGDWDTSKATWFGPMFSGCTSFNTNLAKWAVSKVASFRSMFSGATSFEGQGLDRWITTSAQYIQQMFKGATTFDQDLSSCKVHVFVRHFSSPSKSFEHQTRSPALMHCTKSPTTRCICFFVAPCSPSSYIIHSNSTRVRRLHPPISRPQNYCTGNVGKVTKNIQWVETFANTASLSSCNKAKMLSQWNGNSVFKTNWAASWVGSSCTCIQGYGASIGAANACVECIAGWFNAVVDTSFCQSCVGGMYQPLPGKNACIPKAVQNCPPGKGFDCGFCSPLADDSSCADCDVGKFSKHTDANACTLLTAMTCAVGEGLTAGSRKADNTCSTCSAGKFSATVGTEGCTLYTVTLCPVGEGFTAGSGSRDAVCAPCLASTYSSGLDKTACVVHSTPTCSSGTPLVAGTATSDATCAGACSKSTFSADGGACKPHSVSKCPPGSGYVPGSASTDTSCVTCDSGSFSAADDTGACLLYTLSKCKAGEAFSTGSATKDSSCATCVQGSFSAANDANGCVTWTIASCPKGEGYAAGSASADASCTACAGATFDATAGDKTACSAHSNPACPAGSPLIAGTASSDAVCAAACASGTWLTGGACKLWSVDKCPKGSGYTAGSASSDATCNPCLVATYSAANDTGECVSHSKSSCGSSGDEFTAGDATKDAACSPRSPTPPSVQVLKNSTRDMNNKLDQLNNNQGNLSAADAEDQREKIIQELGDSLSASSLLGDGSVGSPVNDLSTASNADKQEVIGAVIDTLAAATANTSQISADTASVVVQVLSNLSTFAGDIRVNLTRNDTVKIIETLSTALDARGTTAPDEAIDSISTIIEKIVAASGGNDVSVRTDRVAVKSTRAPSTGTWITAFAPGDAATGSGGTGGGASTTATAVQNAIVALDEPIKLLAVPIAAAGSPGSTTWGTPVVTTTIVQYSGGRNPFWPSPHSSSDIITLTITPDLQTTWEKGTELPPAGARRQRRALLLAAVHNRRSIVITSNNTTRATAPSAAAFNGTMGHRVLQGGNVGGRHNAAVTGRDKLNVTVMRREEGGKKSTLLCLRVLVYVCVKDAVIILTCSLDGTCSVVPYVLWEY